MLEHNRAGYLCTGRFRLLYEQDTLPGRASHLKTLSEQRVRTEQLLKNLLKIFV